MFIVNCDMNKAVGSQMQKINFQTLKFSFSIFITAIFTHMAYFIQSLNKIISPLQVCTLEKQEWV